MLLDFKYLATFLCIVNICSICLDLKQIFEFVNVYEAKTCTIKSYTEILKTRPPCMYGHKCPCPCDSGGKCVPQKVLH